MLQQKYRSIATWAIEKPYEIILAWVWAFRDTDTAKTEARLPVTSPSEYSYTENRLIIDGPPWIYRCLIVD